MTWDPLKGRCRQFLRRWRRIAPCQKVTIVALAAITCLLVGSLLSCPSVSRPPFGQVVASNGSEGRQVALKKTVSTGDRIKADRPKPEEKQKLSPIISFSDFPYKLQTVLLAIIMVVGMFWTVKIA